MQCNVVFAHVKHCVLKIILDALFEFISKDKYEKKMRIDSKKNFERKIYVNSFCLCQFVVFKPISYCFEETIRFDVKASFVSRPISRLIR